MKKIFLLMAILLSFTATSYSKESKEKESPLEIFNTFVPFYIGLFNGYNNTQGYWAYGMVESISDEDDNGELQIIDYIFAKNDTNVFYKGDVIQGADPNTFKLYFHRFGVDKNSGYFRNEAIKGSDASTFKVLNNYYAIDKLSAYIFPNPFMPSDLASFEVIQGSYAKDKQTIYSMGVPFIPSDIATFRVIGNAYAEDKNNIYYGDKIITEVDKSTFRIINDTYSADTKNVYVYGKILKDADPNTFVSKVGLLSGVDKNNYFTFDKKVNREMYLANIFLYGSEYFRVLKQEQEEILKKSNESKK